MDYAKSLRQLVGTRPLILPGAVVILLNAQKEILLQHRADGSWGLPGGLMEPGESFEETARREVEEETGLKVGTLNRVEVVSGSDYYLKLKNGDELYSITAIFVASDVQGQLSSENEETLDLAYFSLEDLPTANMSKAYQKHIAIYKASI